MLGSAVCLSVCMSVCQNRLTDSRRHLVSALVESNDTVSDGGPWPPGQERFEDLTLGQNTQLIPTYEKRWFMTHQVAHRPAIPRFAKLLWFLFYYTLSRKVFQGILWVGLLYTCYFHNFGTNSFNLLNYYLSQMLLYHYAELAYLWCYRKFHFVFAEHTTNFQVGV